MTFPQPAGGASVAAGQSLYRLFTPIVSAGDIYEIDVAAHALILGPESDIAKVNITFYDDLADGKVQTALISPTRSWVARVDARNEQQYPLSGGKLGRILVTSADLYDTTYRPTQFNENASQDTITFQTPKIDVVAYYENELPTLQPQRSDATWMFQYLPNNGRNKSSWLILPYYGRKYGFIDMVNPSVSNGTIEVRGVNLTTLAPTVGGGVVTKSNQQESSIVAAATPVNAGAHFSKVIRASVDGEFDFLVIRLINTSDDGGPLFPIRITTSDQAL